MSAKKEKNSKKSGWNFQEQNSHEEHSNFEKSSVTWILIKL